MDFVTALNSSVMPSSLWIRLSAHSPSRLPLVRPNRAPSLLPALRVALRAKQGGQSPKIEGERPIGEGRRSLHARFRCDLSSASLTSGDQVFESHNQTNPRNTNKKNNMKTFTLTRGAIIAAPSRSDYSSRSTLCALRRSRERSSPLLLAVPASILISTTLKSTFISTVVLPIRARPACPMEAITSR